MFGGQDGNAQAPQNGDDGGAKDETLSGVTDLVGGTAAPAADNSSGNGSGDGTMPVPPHHEQSSGDAGLHAAGAGDDDLLDIKQQALQQLTPLVGHLDQSPLDKFRTTMMLIQASDNKSLLKEAYQSAQAIEDEKVRAQALLDVVNEINYFTQSNKPQQ